jgi:hypothetical protein
MHWPSILKIVKVENSSKIIEYSSISVSDGLKSIKQIDNDLFILKTKSKI